MKQLLILLLIVALHIDAQAQECRAETDCSTGRCVSTIKCDQKGANSQQRPPSTVQLPAPIQATFNATTPNELGVVVLRGKLIGNSRIVDIRINGLLLETKIDPDGNFQVKRGLSIGSNEFSLAVTDEFGRVSTVRLSVYRDQIILTSTEPQKRIALVIGNANYQTSPLTNPVNDANDFSEVLKAAGFEIQNLRNANISAMRSALRNFGDQLKYADAGIVYFAGHGVEVNGRNYLIPVGADIRREDEIPDQALDMGAILEKIETARKPTIVILDACRSNPFGTSFRSNASGLKQVETPSGTLLAFSTSPGKVAADGKGRNSPYTKYLVQELKKKSLHIEQVLKNVRKLVLEETNGSQTPWENTSLTVDFIVSRN